MEETGVTPPRKPGRGWMIGVGATLLAVAAFLLYRRYGAEDVTQAETMVYGMFLFLALAALVAVPVGLLLRLLRGRRSPPLGIGDREEDQ
ncbi:MAG: hypothetical protein D6807_05620 [Alphaproteobacteria bacterium]|nr:MAG: hypothetical protein D6807_05620 [Alphaproteobacteria bacterium]